MDRRVDIRDSEMVGECEWGRNGRAGNDGGAGAFEIGEMVD